MYRPTEGRLVPFLPSGDLQLYYEDTGQGTPIVFVHEFSGDHRSWEQQVRFFTRRYRCVTYDARGYLPSDVPADVDRYSQANAVGDLLAVLDHLTIEWAHIVGLSMGGFTTLHFGLTHPDRARSLTVAAVGYGSTPEGGDGWKADVDHLSRFYGEDPVGAAASHGSAPGRVPFMVKDPRGWQEFAAQLAEHAAVGSSNTMRGVQSGRQNL